MLINIKNTAILCFTLLSLSFIYGQNSNSTFEIELGFAPEFIDFSPNGKYMIAVNENQYMVWDIEVNKQILKEKFKFKMGRFVKGISVPTGSGYFLFGKENVFMTIDYQHNQTEIKAFDLKDGSLLWESDQLDIGVSVAETVINAHASGIVTNEINGVSSRRSATRAKNAFTQDRFLERLVNYIPEKKAIALNGKNGLQLVGVRKGNTIWTQADFKGGIGELLFESKSDRMLAITIPATDGALDLLTTTPEIIAMDAQTGKILWKVNYDGDFVPGNATIIDNTLVLQYLQLSLIDLETGTERSGDVKEGLNAARNVTQGLKGIMAIDKAMGGSFGAGSETTSKYNRLISRKLHFNENGKLCYFTMFNKKGAWGTGGVKGYMIIDIHQDKIENQVYGVLGQQWTEIQDEMFDGIFYVKARGNFNRTIIKALNAQTGDEIFETEKAKNSADISKQFNPFIIDTINNQLIDVVSKGIYVFDAKAGNKISYTSTKDLGVGTVKYSEFYPQGLLVVGTKGVAMMDYKGNINGSFATKNLKKYSAVEDELWLLEKNRFLRISGNNGAVIEETKIGKSNFITFSPTGRTLAKLKGTKVELFRR
ncbi:PQQ-binding-like beta-propeller repeat protein [Aequorivita sinensis]|uniref:outer membrane protein assembly factor BamB family protein n=1 Tax=Aequorivita sinensis TaxID=1382458 RepID=UPI00230074E1|nr:PQQ-binding-like beta-propeller repeat protein [Aequorivita sinensis]